MVNRSQSTRHRVLEEGLDLLSRSGLSGVTLGGLAAQVGMSKSGVFAHFKSKEEVQIELLSHLSRRADDYVFKPATQQPAGLPRLEALVSRWLGWSEKAGLPGGCPVAAAMFELDDVEGPIREVVLGLERAWRERLAETTREAVALGQLCPGLDVEQFVWELCGIYLGHHVAHRFVRDASADRRADTAFRALLERAGVPPPSPPAVRQP